MASTAIPLKFTPTIQAAINAILSKEFPEVRFVPLQMSIGDEMAQVYKIIDDTPPGEKLTAVLAYGDQSLTIVFTDTSFTVGKLDGEMVEHIRQYLKGKWSVCILCNEVLSAVPGAQPTYTTTNGFTYCDGCKSKVTIVKY